MKKNIKKLAFLIDSDLHKKLFFLSIIAVFIIMLTLNFLTPLFGDDYAYASSTSVLDALQKEYEQYMGWGGRSVAHFIARLFLMLPKGVFNCFNSIVFIGLTLLIYRMSNPKKAHSVLLYLFIVFLFWLYTIDYGQVILWLTGSANYLWSSFIILCFLLPYNSYINSNKVFSHKYLFPVGMFFLGIIAGWCNENTSGGAILLVLLILVYCRIFKHQIEKWMVSGLLGSMIGFLFMILAPGNFVRSEYIHRSFPDDRHALIIIGNRISVLTDIIRHSFAPLIIFFIILITIHIMLQKDVRRIYMSFAFFAVSIATIYAMVLTPTHAIAGRAMFGATVFMILACAHAFAGLSIDVLPYKVAAVCLIAILGFQFTTSFIVRAYDIGMTWKVIESRQRFIESEVAQGNLNIVVPHDLFPNPLTQWNPGFGTGDLSTDASHWINRSFADKYALESIQKAD